jgi:hypothetical protein
MTQELTGKEKDSKEEKKREEMRKRERERSFSEVECDELRNKKQTNAYEEQHRKRWERNRTYSTETEQTVTYG